MCDLWLDYCYYFFAFIKVEDFTLNRDKTRLAKEIYAFNFKYLLEKNKDLIDEFYSVDDTNVDNFLNKINKEKI